jgi:hypothetical protein
MTADKLRTDLLQQIEQADEKLLRIVSSVLEAVKVEYLTEEEGAGEQAIADYSQHLKLMTYREMKAELAEAMAEYERGDYVTLAEMEQESAKW